MAEVHLSRRALLDIEAIDAHSLDRWGERVAEKYLADLCGGMARLEENPNLLQVRPASSLRLRFYAVREHVLICDVIGERIFVLALRNAVMDLPRRIAELEPQLVLEAELFARKIADAEGGDR